MMVMGDFNVSPVYTSTSSLSSVILQKLAGENGFSFDYADHLLMVDNFLQMFEIGDQITRLPKDIIDANNQRKGQ